LNVSIEDKALEGKGGNTKTKYIGGGSEVCLTVASLAC